MVGRMGVVIGTLSGFHAREQQEFACSIHFILFARDRNVHPLALKTLKTIVLLCGQTSRTGSFDLSQVGANKSNQFGWKWKISCMYLMATLLHLSMIHRLVHLEVAQATLVISEGTHDLDTVFMVENNRFVGGGRWIAPWIAGGSKYILVGWVAFGEGSLTAQVDGESGRG